MKRYVKSASLALIACATSALAEPSYEDVVKMKYHFAEWGGTTKAEYSHCLKRVPLGSLVLPTNGMDIVVKHKNNRLLVFSKDKTLIDVRTSAQDSIAAAHNALIERFSLMASTRLMKPCQSIGDVCFVDTGEGWSSVVFARNNVEANVCSQTLLINAMDIAAQIDGKVLEASIPVGADALRKAAGATDRRGAADMDAGKGDGAGHRGKVPVLLDSQCAPGCTNHLLKPAQNLEMVAATNVAERAKKGCRFATATPEEDHAAAIRALGVTNIVVKNPGYFFYGGEYIPPPYVVTREGDFLKINGRYIRFFCKWPQAKGRKWHVMHTMPEVPSSVNEKTSEFDPAVRKYIDDCFDYWLTNHAGDESRWAAAMISDVLKLPCVKDAYVDEYGGLTVIWTGGQGKTCFDYSFMASNPSWWDPQPIDPKAFSIEGDNEAVGLAEQISDGNYLFWPLKNGGPWLSGSNLEPEFAKVLENIDKCATAKELSVACGWYPRRVELCADLLMHRDSFDAGLRKRISNRVVAIEAEKRAERERKEQEAAERRRRAAEAYERRTVAELEPTVKWTPENARKGGMRFYAFYKDLHWSGDRPVPYEFWPRSTQPGDKWRHRLRENSVQAFGGFFGGHEPSNTKIQEDIAAGCKRIKGKLRPETIQWSISCDFPVAKDDPAVYARIPMLVSANLNPACLLREWDGAKDADKVIPLGPKSGAEKSLFGDECAVIVFNDGSGEIIPAEELTYARIYRRAFKGPPLLGYLTVRGFVEPKGMSGDRTTKPPNHQTIALPNKI